MKVSRRSFLRCLPCAVAGGVAAVAVGPSLIDRTKGLTVDAIRRVRDKLRYHSDRSTVINSGTFGPTSAREFQERLRARYHKFRSESLCQGDLTDPLAPT